MATTPRPPAGKTRYCWYCGQNMGWIANRDYDTRDTCESAECAREVRSAAAEDRQDAHDQIDRDRGDY